MSNYLDKDGLTRLWSKIKAYIHNYVGNLQEIAPNNVVDIAHGGTNATTVEEARQKLNFIGTNPIASTADDTTANWAAFGSGFAFFNATRLNNQPEAIGFVENIMVGEMIYQTFYAMNGKSSVWHRSGNKRPTVGWYSKSANWVKSLDETNGLQMELAWQNASPTSNFNAQNVSLNLSDGEAVLVKCKIATSTAETACYAGFVGETIVMNNVYNLTNNGTVPGDCVRTATIATNGITFSTGYSKDHTDANPVSRPAMMIPYMVYVIKGVL